jgi:hypothetical protein
MKRLKTIFNKGIFTRFKSAVAALGCLGILFGAVAVAPLQAKAQGSRYALTVHNQSRYQIDRLFLSASDVDSWGPDQLGQRVIYSYSDFTLTNIRPGEYDIKVVDHQGDGCVIRRVSVFEDKQWTLTDASLLRCEGY